MSDNKQPNSGQICAQMAVGCFGGMLAYFAAAGEILHLRETQAISENVEAGLMMGALFTIAAGNMANMLHANRHTEEVQRMGQSAGRAIRAVRRVFAGATPKGMQ